MEGDCTSPTYYFLTPDTNPYLIAPLVFLPFIFYFALNWLGAGEDSQGEWGFSWEELNRATAGLGREKVESDWRTLGYWKSTTFYAEACEALALRVLLLSSPKPLGRHLDVSHASGDSLLLLINGPRFPHHFLLPPDSKPSSTNQPAVVFPSQSLIAGTTDLLSSATTTALRISKLYPKKGRTVELHHGDAIFRPESLSVGGKRHPLDPDQSRKLSSLDDDDLGLDGEGEKGVDGAEDGGEEGKGFDSVVCIDSAYRFDTRQLFFERVFARLNPGGTLALSDILSSASYPSLPLPQPTAYTFISSPKPPPPSLTSSSIPTFTLFTRLLMSILSIPRSNIIPIPTLASQLIAIGFVDIRIEDVSHNVYPELRRFVGKRIGGWLGGRPLGKLKSLGMTGKEGVGRYVLISARKPLEGEGGGKETQGSGENAD